MRPLTTIVALTLAAVFVSGATPAAAQTLIGKNDAFLLGGEQNLPMRVVGRNVGGVPIDVMVDSGGKRRSIVVIAPGQRFDHVFAAREIAVLRNTSATRQASARIELTRQLYTLSMRYQSPGK